MEWGQHNHGPNFGRQAADCPRCTALAAGAEPVSQEWRSKAARDAETERRFHEQHFAPGGPHSRRACGPVCTFGDW